MIVIYTDGSCLGNPGTGGWAYTYTYHNQEIKHYGFEKKTTNNRMELLAAINAIESLKNNAELITIHTDSNYLKEGINSWIINWKKNGWKTSLKKDVKNQDLWKILDKLTSKKNISWNWVKGHSKDNLNNLVDDLARNAAENLIQST